MIQCTYNKNKKKSIAISWKFCVKSRNEKQKKNPIAI